MLSLIIKLLTAHLLGDFVFQSDKMVKDIHSKKLKSIYLYIHSLIHLGLIVAITGFKKDYFISAILLSVAHLIIDIITKIYFTKKINSLLTLIIDQILHLVTISIFIYYYHPYSIAYEVIFSNENQVLFLCIISITFLSSIIIKKIIELFNYTINSSGLKDAGKYIGMLERLFIFLFVISDFWEGIGFLLAAKSIFRFGDLKDKKDVKLTEYILIGTLLSFGLAILIGIIYKKLISII